MITLAALNYLSYLPSLGAPNESSPFSRSGKCWRVNDFDPWLFQEATFLSSVIKKADENKVGPTKISCNSSSMAISDYYSDRAAFLKGQCDAFDYGMFTFHSSSFSHLLSATTDPHFSLNQSRSETGLSSACSSCGTATCSTRGSSLSSTTSTAPC